MVQTFDPFLNIFENSLDALIDGGQIKVSTRLNSIANKIHIEFSDTGVGLSPKARGNLFLPHFTTKKRGTGIGLAIVNRIVEDHNGTITVRENHPKGTTFEIEFPHKPASLNTNPRSKARNRKIFSPF